MRGVPVVASDGELDHATPLRTAGGEPERDDPTPVRPRAASTPPPFRPYGPESPVLLPGRGPPAAALLLLAGLGAVGLAGGAVYVFYNGRAAVLRPDAPPRPDAHVFYVEPDDAAPDDAAPDAATRDAAPAPADARAVPHDAAPRPPPRPDAWVALDPPIDAAGARPAGAALLTVGANPWGNVLIDGKKIGRTPIEQLSVTAGHHVIEVVFGGEDPPRTLRYTVDLSDGETKDVLADFTRP